MTRAAAARAAAARAAAARAAAQRFTARGISYGESDDPAKSTYSCFAFFAASSCPCKHTARTHVGTPDCVRRACASTGRRWQQLSVCGMHSSKAAEAARREARCNGACATHLSTCRRASRRGRSPVGCGLSTPEARSQMSAPVEVSSSCTC